MSSDVRSGTEIAGFRVASTIGAGAMGTVYLAVDTTTGERVALKVLSPELARDARFRRRFLRESEVAAGLDHPNVIATLAAGETDGLLYLAMPFVEGSDLRALLRVEGKLDPDRAVDLVTQVARALDEAHGRGLVHRDVKPGNILVEATPAGERAYMCDFGLARHVSSVSSLTGERGFVGTIDYVPPEQIEGGSIDARADVYSLGCVLFECLTGERPFDRDSELSVVFAHLNEPAPRVSEARPELRPAFDDVIATALAKSPDDRYSSCGELAAATRAALAGKTARRRPSVRVRRRLLAVGAVAAAVAAAVGAFVATRSGGADEASVPSPRLRLAPNAVSLVDAANPRVRGRVVFAARSLYGLEPTDVAFAGGSAWVMLQGQQRVARVDRATRRVTRSVKLPWFPGSRVATGGGRVWVTEDRGEGVLGIDARTGSIVCRFTVPGTNAGGVAYGAGSVWVAQGASVARVSPQTGRVLLRSRNPGQAEATVWLAYADGAAWSARANGIIRKIDPVTGRITATAKLDGWISDLVVGDGFVWTSKVPEGLVYRLSEDDLSVLGAVQGGPDPERLSFAGGRLWVANGTGRAVSRLDVRSGARRQFAASAETTLVGYDRGLVWTGARPSPRPLPPIAGPELRIATPQSISADPVQTHSQVDEQRVYATCANLLGYPDADGRSSAELRPEIAAAMPVVSRGGRRYTFRVRRGFRFSPPSNESVTAETFRSTVERALSPKLEFRASSVAAFSDLVGASAYRAGRVRHVAGISVRGDTISFTLVKPAGNFVMRLSSAVACPVPRSQPLVVGGPPRPVPSAGPYYLASIEGNRAVLLRNPNYHGPRPRRAERIVYTDDIPTPKAVALADAGAVDYVPSGDPPLAPGGTLDRAYGPGSAAARGGRQRYFREPMPWEDGLVLNAARPLFADLRLRQAVNYALDRTALATAFFDDPNDLIVPPAVVGFRPGRMYPLTPDLRAARRLAGDGSRRALLWYCTNGVFGSPTQGRVAQLIRSQLARIGLALSIARSNCDRQSRYDATSRRADLIMFSGGSPERDPAQFLAWAVHGNQYGSALGPGIWSTPAFQRRVARAAALRGNARTREYATLVGRLMQDAPWAVYGSFVYVEYFSPKVGCKLFPPLLGFVDLGALCPPRRR
jgi:ABC-type transport system substrate-binding protein/tRNA A-37 threonylcarbamoyl transferase component Bud32/outer membrane protein assembly factor BamB